MKNRGFFTKRDLGCFALTVIFLLGLIAAARENMPPVMAQSYEIVVVSENGDVTPEKDPLLNLNTATLEELDTLSGIGPVLAQRIIDYREESGGFSSVEELMEVKGIGTQVLEKNLDKITVE